jgi:predicted site-specific integrase-resolvase
MHRDRLARIGSNFLGFIFSKVDTKLVVHGTNADAEDHHDLGDDPGDDLLAIATLFVVSDNGRRAAENRK